MSTSPNGTGFNFQTIYKTLFPRMQNSEAQLKSEMESMGPTMSTQELILLQSKTQEWTLLAQMNSNLVKELGDTLKSIVQKSS